MKPIHFNLYDPASGFHLFGKPKANTPTQYQVIYCKNSENCPLHKRGECVLSQTFSSDRCPYGQYQRVTGPTKRAKNFRHWQEEQNEKFKGVPYLKSPRHKLAFIGDYVYFPYTHANMNKSVPFLAHGGFMLSGNNFILLKDFTVETLEKIINFYPQALMGGEITSYQKEEVPKILLHLEEEAPHLYLNLLEKHPEFTDRYNLKVKNYVGRTAILKTINPCEFTTSGSREGDYRVKWTWDGTKLSTNKENGSWAYNETWGAVKDIAEMNISIVPSEKTVIKITDNNQVNKKTVFVD